jgi:hypothetical protein
MVNENNFQNNLDPRQDPGQGVDNFNSVYGQSTPLSMDKNVFVHGQECELSMDKAELVYGQEGYLSMDKAAEYTFLSEKTLRRRVREILISVGLDWKSSQIEIEKKIRKIKKINVRKNILGLTSFDWDLSVVWLNELKAKTVPVHRQSIDKPELSIDKNSPVQGAQFMVDGPLGNVEIKDADSIEIDGRRYTKEHLKDILENYKEEKETRKTMMELQRQINVVMAQMGQIQKMMLLKSSDNDSNE